MSMGQKDYEIYKYHQYMLNFFQAADRAISPVQSAIYTRYAQKISRHIGDLRKVA